MPHITEGTDKKGLALLPGLVDLRAHLSDPGQNHKESLEEILTTATRGGVTSIIAQPTTDPPLDKASTIRSIIERTKTLKGAHLYFTGALTVGLMGKQLAEIGLMKTMGIVGISNGNRTVQNTTILNRALTYASMFTLPIHLHAMDNDLSKEGLMHTSALSTKMGLKGIPAIAEELEVMRLLIFAKTLNARIHISHISSKGAVERIKVAKQQGINISADVCHHHIALTQDAIEEYRTHTKILPPLREEQDREALLTGLKEGTIDAIVSDHKAQNPDTKRLPFAQASFGAVGLQTLLPITLDLWRNGVLSLNEAIRRVTLIPATIANIKAGTLEQGAQADITLVDLEQKVKITKDHIWGKCKNTPYENTFLQGNVEETFVAGNKIY